MVEDIARAGHPYSGSLARVLLEEISRERGSRVSCPELPGTADKGRGATGTEERGTTDFKVTATPNPASSQGTVDYILPEGSPHAALSIVNTLGEKMIELGLEGNRGSRAIGLQKLPAGVYFIVVKEPNGRRCASKLVIQ